MAGSLSPPLLKNPSTSPLTMCCRYDNVPVEARQMSSPARLRTAIPIRRDHLPRPSGPCEGWRPIQGGQNTPTSEQMTPPAATLSHRGLFSVRFWDYSQMHSNRTSRNSLKTIDRKISTREKFRFSRFASSSLSARCYIAVTDCRCPRQRHSQESVFLADTPVGIEKGLSHSESTTSPKLSRYTFDMFWNTQKGGSSRF